VIPDACAACRGPLPEAPWAVDAIVDTSTGLETTTAPVCSEGCMADLAAVVRSNPNTLEVREVPPTPP
jgi:hypothetical protein